MEGRARDKPYSLDKAGTGGKDVGIQCRFGKSLAKIRNEGTSNPPPSVLRIYQNLGNPGRKDPIGQRTENTDRFLFSLGIADEKNDRFLDHSEKTIMRILSPPSGRRVQTADRCNISRCRY